jgi:hypothetical protein
MAADPQTKLNASSPVFIVTSLAHTFWRAPPKLQGNIHRRVSKGEKYLSAFNAALVCSER